MGNQELGEDTKRSSLPMIIHSCESTEPSSRMKLPGILGTRGSYQSG